MSWLAYSRKDERTDRERYLEDELEREREARERERTERYEREKAREEERNRIREEERRNAEDWPEALRKQIYLFEREANQYEPDDEPDDWFGSGAKACRRALEMWAEEEQQREAVIAALEAQIAALRAEVRQAVGDRLAAENENHGWQEVARALQSDDDPGDWLQW